MSARNVFLKIHLYLGLVAAIFLVILGLTGSVMAFETDIDHWVHPSLWYVKAGSTTLPEGQLVEAVEQRYKPGRVAMVQISRQGDLAQVMSVVNPRPGGLGQLLVRRPRRVYVNPYNGTILGDRTRPGRDEVILAAIHQFHLRLVGGSAGKLIVSIAGLILCIQVPLGLVLWWRTKRAKINWKGSWFRISFDAHHVVGLYAGLFLFIAAITGILIGFEHSEPLIYQITHSSPPSFAFARPPKSAADPGGAPIGIDRAIAIARETMPGTTVAAFQPPIGPAGSYNILVRFPEETSEAVHSNVAIDQYSGKVLETENYMTESLGYRVIRFNRSIHTGDVWGLTGHIIVSLSSLLLVVMVVTGVLIWWKKLAV